MALNDRMEFDCPIEIMEGGKVVDRHDLHAPEFYESKVEGSDWVIYGKYANCEYIGSGLESALLESPGIYVVVANMWNNADIDTQEAEPTILEGWAILEYVA